MNSPLLIRPVVSSDEGPSSEIGSEMMPRDEAVKIFQSQPPPKPRVQSAYKRFKNLVLSSKVDCDIPADDIKKEWDMVKNVDVDAVPPDSRTHFMKIKHLVESHSLEEEARHEAELFMWCRAFDEATTCVLTWLTFESSETNFLPLQTAITRVETITNEVWSTKVRMNCGAPLRHAQERIQTIATAYEPKLFAYLRQVDDQGLLHHCRDHANLQSAYRVRAKESDELLRDLNLLAKGIPYEIIAGIERQLLPTDGPFPEEGIVIEYSRGGVSPKVFGLAFDLPPHAKTVLIRASFVGNRRNHESTLVCSDIRVSHNQLQLTATAVYFLKAL
ncbi:hypothetical protein MHU86_2910 [Fragilaria crotonensis]|nr:hypothetical protein MHU86_2910 [Fragilaria crotonensis]